MANPPHGVFIPKIWSDHMVQQLYKTSPWLRRLTNQPSLPGRNEMILGNGIHVVTAVYLYIPGRLKPRQWRRCVFLKMKKCPYSPKRTFMHKELGKCTRVCLTMADPLHPPTQAELEAWQAMLMLILEERFNGK